MATTGRKKRKRTPSVETEHKAKRQRQQQDAQSLIASFGADAVICYTDGSCKKQGYAAGAGAIMRYLLDVDDASSSVEYERYVPIPVGTNQVGELMGLETAIDLVMADAFILTSQRRIEIMTDSKYAQGMISLGWNASANVDLVNRIREKFAKLQATNVVNIHWVKGHVGITGNERADVLASFGVDDAFSFSEEKEKA